MQSEYKDHAAAIGLKPVDPESFTIERKIKKDAASYMNGKKPVSKSIRDRLESLVIPPAWTNVFCCSDDNGHIQVVGRDALGRQQYIYHPEWVAVRDKIKTDRLLTFGNALPRIRKRVSREIARGGQTNKSIAALAVRLIDVKVFRAGHEKYAKDGGRGIATLKKSDLKIEGNVASFIFAGKSKKKNEVTIKDKRLVTRLKALS
ncbi:DNA topoisomerase IB [Phyllobacterium sp. R2-JL]|nr:DNA topoisomerase IB [Phyllobacterium calauticae]